MTHQQTQQPGISEKCSRTAKTLRHRACQVYCNLYTLHSATTAVPKASRLSRSPGSLKAFEVSSVSSSGVNAQRGVIQAV
eukprot:5964104-Pleurochrysis_carterae.AAC.1